MMLCITGDLKTQRRSERRKKGGYVGVNETVSDERVNKVEPLPVEAQHRQKPLDLPPFQPGLSHDVALSVAIQLFRRISSKVRVRPWYGLVLSMKPPQPVLL
jgi:hypothetical protein